MSEIPFPQNTVNMENVSFPFFLQNLQLSVLLAEEIMQAHCTKVGFEKFKLISKIAETITDVSTNRATMIRLHVATQHINFWIYSN